MTTDHALRQALENALREETAPLKADVLALAARLDTLSGQVQALRDEVAALRPLAADRQAVEGAVGINTKLIALGFSVTSEEARRLRQRVSALEATS